MSWEAPEVEQPSARFAWGQVILGIVAVPVMHGAVGLGLWSLAWLVEEVGPVGGDLYGVLLMWLMSVGLSQLIYVLPAFLLALVWRRPVAAGIAIGAGLTLLLQGACYGVFCATFSL